MHALLVLACLSTQPRTCAGAERIRALVREYEAKKSQQGTVRPPATPVVEVCAESHHPYVQIVAREAARTGVDPVVMQAIEIWESAGYKSRKCVNLKNPAGIEFRYFDDVACERAGRWAKFKSLEDGIKAHAEVLANRRYRSAWGKDRMAAVLRIGKAGYCQNAVGCGWVRGVQAIVRRLARRS